MKRSTSFQHLVAILQKTSTAAAQDAINKARLQAVERALTMRPHYLSVIHNLPAGAQNLPVVVPTDPDLNTPVIITGAITDGGGRKADFYIDDENKKPYFRATNNARSTISAFCGKTADGEGFEGVLHLPEPILLDEYQSINLRIYKEDAAAATVNTVFCGTRIIDKQYSDANLTDNNRRDVVKAIEERPTPQTKFETLPVLFDQNGNCEVDTPKSSEPLFIVGFRSTFTNAKVRFGDGVTNFSKEYFPLWALASEPLNQNRLFNLLNNPLFMAANDQLTFYFKNKVNDLLAADGTLEILMRTV